MHYDAVIVLSGGIRKTASGFAPTTYEDDDGFGMMGGHVRIMAAAALYGQHAARHFVFTTGVTAKTTGLFGEGVPSEASVYAAAFLDRANNADAASAVLLEDRSTNTIGNVREFLKIIKDSGWQHVAVLSSKYHLPRIKALCEMLGASGRIDFLAAEDIVRQAWPGTYNAEIDTAYASDAGKKRLQNEAEGTAAIEAGGYNPAEHQLGK